MFLKRNRLQAGQCVFIDDSAKNIAGARGIGMQGVHFTGPETLAAELRAMGFAV